jgi:esterase/lipase superfamily enzyme
LNGSLKVQRSSVFAFSVVIVLSFQAIDGFASPQQKIDRRPIRKKQDDKKADWVDIFLDQNPLEQKPDAQLKLDDLVKALRKTEQQPALMRHFRRANLSPQEADNFLRKAMDSQSVQLRIEATIELQRRGSLAEVVRERLSRVKLDRNRDVARAAGQAVDLLQVPEVELAELPGVLDELVEQLGSADPNQRDAAHARFGQLGLYSVPTLLQLLKEDNALLRKSAALLLGEIIAAENSARRTYAADEPAMQVRSMPLPKAGPGSSSGPAAVRLATDETPKKIQVFFGTNRQIVAETSRPKWMVWALPIAFLVLLFLLFAPLRKSNDDSDRHSAGCFGIAAKLLILFLMLTTAWFWNSAIQQFWSMHEGIRFGPQREQPDVIHYGYCTVSLPPTHQSGELERPWLGPEDESRHVVLRQTKELNQDDFYQAVKRQLDELPQASHDCFVFVHGFNVAFDEAAMRTAQIAYDLKAKGQFEGVPLFYSWPSAGSPIMYSWDRAEIRNSKRYVKRFLEEVASKTNADRIHIIAHSMGADLVSQAITEIDSNEKIFHQIVLAAPDIDADVFRQEIVPALKMKSVRTTMYCSSNDFALQISYQVNNARRVGDTSDGVFVIQDVDTIDASEIPTDLLGHSYYGDCVPLATDIAALMKSNASPNSETRDLKPRPWKSLFYWVFGNQGQ